MTQPKLKKCSAFFQITEDGRAVCNIFDHNGTHIVNSNEAIPARVRTAAGRWKWAAEWACRVARDYGLEDWQVFEDDSEETSL